MSEAPAWLPLVLWPVGGAAVGVVVGGALSSMGVALRMPAGAGALLGGLLVVGLVAAAGVGAFRVGARALEVRRERRIAEAAARRRGAEAASRTASLACAIAFPEVPDDVPDVWGVGDAMRVRVSATAAGKPASGATVRVTLAGGDSASPREVARGALGASGAVDAPLVVATPGDVTLEAAVELADARARATRTLRVVRYEDEVESLFHDFRAWANKSVPGCRDALTAREVADVLSSAAGAEGRQALAEVARIYELVAYGERDADRQLYVALVRAFGALESSGLFGKYERRPEAAEA